MIYGRSPGSAMERIEDVPVCAAMELGTGLPHGETHPAEARAGCTESFEIRRPPAWGLVPLEYAKRGILEPGGSRRIKEIEPEDRKSRLYLFFRGMLTLYFSCPHSGSNSSSLETIRFCSARGGRTMTVLAISRITQFLLPTPLVFFAACT